MHGPKSYFFWITFSFLIITGSVRGQNDPEGFELLKKEERISIYERWVFFPGSQPPVRAREVKGVFLIRSTIYEILSIMKNESTIKVWQKHVSKFKVYPHTDSTLWHEYSYHDIPWPVSDQDHFLEYRLQEKKPGEYFFISFKSQKNEKLAPVLEDVTRMELAGTWELEQLNPNEVRVTYRIFSMPIGIPRIFTDPVIRSNLMSTIKALTKLAEE
jgi:hypothetical protein